MRKEVTFSAFIVLAVLLAVGVYAAGTSTSTTVTDTAKAVGTAAVNTVQDIRVQCDSKTSLRDRIDCRLSYRDRAVASGTYDVESDIADESCIGLAGDGTDRCRNLYNVAAQCYDSAEGRERLTCIREKAGLVSRERANDAPKESRERYMVLLLYHLQEKVEDKLEEGSITQEEASDLIAKIVEIKRLVLGGESKEDIKQGLMGLRESWNEVME